MLVAAFELVCKDLQALSEEICECDDHAALVGVVQQAANVTQQIMRQLVVLQDQQGGWAQEGFVSLKQWLAHHSGLSPAAAGSLVQQAKHLLHMPHTLAAASAGVLNEDQVRLLVRGRAAAPERYDEETDRVFSALDPKAMAVAVRQWIDTASQEQPPAEPECGLWLSETLNGTWKLDATLSPEDGKLVDAALQKHLRPLLNGRRDGDPALKDTSIPQLRAQALTDLADADLRRDLPANARNNRYRINLNVRLQPDGTITPEDPVPPEAWCDATFIRIVMGAQGEVLDVGRTTRHWPDPIATAIYARDRHCQFPGCDSPANRCDIHHRHHWEHGGETSVNNGILLCRRHHTFTHRHHWTIDRHHTFRQPDGTIFHQPTPQCPKRE